MAVGLSTYAFFWEWSDRNPTPITLEAMLRRTAALGATVFQICDYPPVESMTADQLSGIRRLADDLGLTLEVGTRGVRPEHLLRYLDIAEALQARLLRSMLQRGPETPSLQESIETLTALVPELERRDVTLGLETYEQVPTSDLRAVIEAVGSPRVGVCLDPGNTVAALESPRDVVRTCADVVVNLHVKDFRFSQRDGWVGFTFAGAPLGEGLLNYAAMVDLLRPDERGINQIIEHWVPWQGDAATTVALEREWTEHNLTYLGVTK